MIEESIEVIQSVDVVPVVGTFTTRKGTFDRGIIEETWHGKFYTRQPGFEIYPNDNVIDIGAHIGAFAVYAAKFGAKVMAFEPEKENYMMLIEQVMLNPEISENMHTFNVAVTGDGRDVTMVKCATPENTGGGWTSRQGDDHEHPDVQGETVSSTKLDDICGDRVDFLKMDCEGAEYEILMQARDKTIKKIKKIAMEWHGGKPEFLKLMKFLQKRGFSCEFGGSEDMGWAYFWRA